jgi:hypothetical protein
MSRFPHPADSFEFLLLEQQGVFTHAQARECGVSRGLLRAHLDARRWQCVGRGIIVAHNGAIDDVTTMWTALLGCGPGALISHHSAGFLQQLVDTVPLEVHVTVPAVRKINARPGVSIHRTRNPLTRAVGLRLPQTSVEDAVLDLADQTARPDRVIALVVAAIAKRKTTAARMEAALQNRSHARWRELLRDILGDSDGVESVLEFRYRRDVERAHGLPASRSQAVIVVGGVEQRRDDVSDEWRVVVELDGRLGHVGVGACQGHAARQRGGSAR